MKIVTHLSILSYSLILIIACTANVNAYDNASSFKYLNKYTTFGFYPVGESKDSELSPQVTQLTQTALTAELERRGLVNSDTPDLKVDFRIVVEEKFKGKYLPGSATISHVGKSKLTPRRAVDSAIRIEITDTATETIIFQREYENLDWTKNSLDRDIETPINEIVNIAMQDFSD